MALLGEMTLQQSKIVISKNSGINEDGDMPAVSYVVRSPWVRHQSVDDNIQFGHLFDEERYHAILECYALKPDLVILEDGDAREIGARGVGLLGGQKRNIFY